MLHQQKYLWVTQVHLALGGSLEQLELLPKHEIVLAITGGLFVLEAVSVIVQVDFF